MAKSATFPETQNLLQEIVFIGAPEGWLLGRYT